LPPASVPSRVGSSQDQGSSYDQPGGITVPGGKFGAEEMGTGLNGLLLYGGRGLRNALVAAGDGAPKPLPLPKAEAVGAVEEDGTANAPKPPEPDAAG